MNDLDQKHSFESGVSLISVVVAMGLAGMIAAILSKTLVNADRYSAHVQRKTELNNIRSQISQSMSCDHTLAGIANLQVNPPVLGSCPSGPYQIRSKSNQALFPSGKIGDHMLIEARCTTDGGVSGLDIFVKHVIKNTTTAKVSKFNNQTLDWKSILPGNTKMCEQYFGALPSVDCDLNQGKVMVGITPGGTPICGNLPFVQPGASCTGNQVLYGFNLNGTPLCKPMAEANDSCPTGQTLYGYDANGNKRCKQLRVRSISHAETTHISQGSRTLNNYDTCMLSNVELDTTGTSGGSWLDCQISKQSGTKNWILWKSNSNSAGLCAMRCVRFDFD